MASTARVLRWAACLLAVVLGGVFGWQLMLETAAGKDATQAAADIVIWAGPWALLTMASLMTPRLAAMLLGLTTAGIIVLWGWWVANPAFWVTWMDQHGPLLIIVATVTATSWGVVGLQLPGVAGVALIALTAIPSATIGALLHPGGTTDTMGLTIGVSSAPFLVAGLILLASTLLPRDNHLSTHTPKTTDPATDRRFATGSGVVHTRTW